MFLVVVSRGSPFLRRYTTAASWNQDRSEGRRANPTDAERAGPNHCHARAGWRGRKGDWGKVYGMLGKVQQGSSRCIQRGAEGEYEREVGEDREATRVRRHIMTECMRVGRGSCRAAWRAAVSAMDTPRSFACGFTYLASGRWFRRSISALQ